jgi:hypothetical protein
MATKKAKGKKAKKANGAKAVAKTNGDGMGREGTVTRFVREALKAGKEIGKVSELASKKFDNDKINKSYVSWHRSQMRKLGLVAAA